LTFGWSLSKPQRLLRRNAEVDASSLPIFRVAFKPAFPKWESLKNKSGKSGVFFESEK
jgi:hypothetical protein